jgi:hypothetical protein
MPSTQKNALMSYPKIVFCLYKSKIANSPQRMAKQHTTTLTPKVYSVGKLANVVWDED